MSSEFPKLLIINGTPIGAQSGAGITLANIFSMWPPENVLQLCYFDEYTGQNPIFTHVPFPSETAFLDNAFRKLIAGTNLSKWFNRDSHGLNSGIPQTTIKGILHDCVRALLDGSPIRIPQNIARLVDQFEPEVIYSNLGGLRILATVLYFARRYNVRVVAHFMDDWPSTIYTTSVLSQWAHNKIDWQVRRCLSLSKCSLAVSEYMAEEYQKRYAIPFVWASNPIEVPEETSLLPDKPDITFTYSGGLHLNRWKSLKIIAEILEEFRHEGYNISLDIYTRQEDELAFKPRMKQAAVIKWKGYVPAHQVPAILQASTVLIHVESFDTNIVDFTRFSFSTKLSQYLASGRPVLAYAPLNIATTHYLEKHKAGLVAEDRQTLREIIGRLIMNSDLRRTIGCRGLEMARLHHNKGTVQRRVLDTLRSNVI